MSLYTPIRSAIKGNCSGTCDSVLVSLQDSLCEKAKTVAKLRSAVESKLSRKLQCIGLPYDKHDQHDYQKPDVHDMVVYYLCGYVHKKVEKATPCSECQASLSAAPEEIALAPRPPQSQLTEMRSFKEGCLRHPSHRFYRIVKEVENVVEHALDSCPIFGDLFWYVLEKLESSQLPSLGCATHHQEVTARVVKFYIIMRMCFFCRKKNLEMELTEKVRTARKKAKLL